jgi:hypothetical protein
MLREPNNEEAERSLIGYTLQLGRRPDGVNGLAPSDFYQPKHETVWAAIRSLTDQQKPCDLPSVLAYLKERGQLDLGKIDSRNITDLYLFELLQAPPIADPAYTANLILKESQRRQIIELHQRGLQQASDPATDLGELLRGVEEQLGGLPGRGGQTAGEHQATRESFPRLDLAALLSPDRPPRQWLWWRLIPEGAAVALVAPAGTGKSLLLLALVVAIARGDRAFAGLRISNRRVLVIDMENTDDDLAERFAALGISTNDVERLDNLIYQHLPVLPPLDTAAGGTTLQSVAHAYELQPGDVVVLDSIQRLTEGKENDSDTIRAYYRHTGLRLKRRGLTVIRTYNTGKDPEKGARGSSGKRDDVDVELFMERDKANRDRFTLNPGKLRLPDVDSMSIERHIGDDGRLHHDTARDPWRIKIAEAIAALDRHNIPPETGMIKAGELLKAKDETVNRDALRVAVKERRHLQR